jgi:hypothetical protein
MDTWLYFPGIKVGQIHLYSSFFLFGGVDWKSLHKTRNAIIPEVDSRLGLFSLAVFCLLSQSFLNNSFVERLQIGLVLFFTSQLFLWVNNQNLKFFNFKHLH